MRRQRAIVVVAILTLLTTLVTLVITQRSLPDRVAVHWGPSWQPDNFVSAPVAWTVTGGVAGLAALLTLLVAVVGSGRRKWQLPVAAGLFLALLFAGLSVLVTIANAGGGEPHLSPLGVVAVIALSLTIPAALAGQPSKAGRVELGRGKRAELLWQGTSRSRFAVPVFLAFLVVGIIVGVWNIVIGAVIAVAGLVVLTLVGIQVEVTRDFVRVRYSGSLGWPATRIPIEEIQQVQAIEVIPRRYGGWGYRGSLRLYGRAAVNLRRGPGLRFTLRDNRVFVVTVDDTDAAVRQLEPLLPTSTEPGSTAR